MLEATLKVPRFRSLFHVFIDQKMSQHFRLDSNRQMVTKGTHMVRMVPNMWSKAMLGGVGVLSAIPSVSVFSSPTSRQHPWDQLKLWKWSHSSRGWAHLTAKEKEQVLRKRQKCATASSLRRLQAAPQDWPALAMALALGRDLSRRHSALGSWWECGSCHTPKLTARLLLSYQWDSPRAEGFQENTPTWFIKYLGKTLFQRP